VYQTPSAAEAMQKLELLKIANKEMLISSSIHKYDEEKGTVYYKTDTNTSTTRTALFS
jgi:hypothetical protein